MLGAGSGPEDFCVLKIGGKRIQKRNPLQRVAMLKIFRKDDGGTPEGCRSHDLSIPEWNLIGGGHHDGFLEQVGGEVQRLLPEPSAPCLGNCLLRSERDGQFAGDCPEEF